MHSKDRLINDIKAGGSVNLGGTVYDASNYLNKDAFDKAYDDEKDAHDERKRAYEATVVIPAASLPKVK